MTLPPIKFPRPIDYFIIGSLAVPVIYVYAGFFSPDSAMLSYGAVPGRILWFIRIVFPLTYAGFVVLYSSVRRHKIDRGSIVLMAVATMVCLIAGYSIADLYYQRWFDLHRKEYHPYLQLMPADFSSLRERAPDTVTVFCLGGSTTELRDSGGVDWPSGVEGILRTTYGLRRLRVYNLGRQWYTSLHTLINFETNLRRFKPSLILYMGSVNDLLQNADFSYFSRGPFREDYGHFYGPVNRIIGRRSLGRYLRDVIAGLWYAKPRRVITTRMFPGLEAYKRNIGTLIELAGHDSIRIVLMTEPYLIKPVMSDEERSVMGLLNREAINDSMVWSSETAVNGMEEYNDALREIADRNKLPLIDLEKEVPKSLVFFRDEVHYRDTAYPMIARFVAERLHEILSAGGINGTDGNTR